jgi:8-oxo-dGTP pyrophosphatase MutT (NUDIX family)
MVRYTQAIAVDKDFMYTLLINRNNNPGKGRLSGVGGHIEENESPENCITREWFEEVGSSLPEDATITKLMTQILPDCENHIFGIVFPKADIYFMHEDTTDNEGIIRWHHIVGENIMNTNNKDVAWDGLIPLCLNLLRREVM